jgi:hypothetical protein
VPGVLGKHIAKMLLAEDQHVVEALTAQRPHEPLRERVRPWRPDLLGSPVSGRIGVMPRTYTVLVRISMTEKTYTRRSSTVSTCRKSQARIPDAWLARNCRQVGDARHGAGPRPAEARARPTGTTCATCGPRPCRRETRVVSPPNSCKC